MPGSRYRQSELRHPIDRKEPSKPVASGIIDSALMLDTIPDMPLDRIDSIRQHIVERMMDVEDGKLLAAVLGVRWRDIGDWPESIDTDPE